MNEENLKKLKNSLPREWARIVAGKVGKSTTWIRKVMRGEAEDPDVIDCAIELAVKKANEKKNADERRQQIINSL